MGANRDPNQPMSEDDIHAEIAHVNESARTARAEGRHLDAITLEDWAKHLRGMLPREQRKSGKRRP
jgi:hypothetical protein